MTVLSDRPYQPVDEGRVWLIPCDPEGLGGIFGMAMGREGDRQGDLIVAWSEMPRSPGHVFYDRLQEVLIAGGFDLFVETACQSYYAPKLGAPSLPPGRYFPDAHGWLFRRDRQRAGHRLALFGFVFTARFSAAGEPGRSGST